MAALSKEQSDRRARVLRTSLLLSAPGPLVTGIAMLSSQSTTQLADFLRRSMELVAIFMAWWVFRQLRGELGGEAGRQARLERTAELSTAGAMAFSGLVLLGIALARLSSFEPGGNVTLGLVIAVLGVLTNGWFWRRYRAFSHEQPNPVMAAQQQLYRAKTTVDLCVTAALAAVAIAPLHPATRAVDLLGSAVVAVYLLWSGLRMARRPLAGWLTRLQPGRWLARRPEKEKD